MTAGPDPAAAHLRRLIAQAPGESVYIPKEEARVLADLLEGRCLALNAIRRERAQATPPDDASPGDDLHDIIAIAATVAFVIFAIMNGPDCAGLTTLTTPP